MPETLDLDVEMVPKILNRLIIYKALGIFLFSGGIILGCFLIGRFVREEIDNWLTQKVDYLVIASTPMFRLPPATPLPTDTLPLKLSQATPLLTFTPTPVPTMTPLPLPPIRLSIPKINLNTTVVETFPITETTWTGEQRLIWQPIPAVVGHYNTSGYPTEGTNIVLAGHNNTEGAVFRYLDELNAGDEVIVFTPDDEFRYLVQEKIIVPYLGNETEAEDTLRFYAAPKASERVTLLSCWPYATNADRIVIVAIAADKENKNAS
jgi:LPXTG-site transpeptidase (sortase) family protein